MTKEKMIERIKMVKSPLKERKALYQIADELGIKYKKNGCGKCATDLWNILREELGLIESAAEVSDFNYEEVDYVWKYIFHTPVVCGGIVYDQNTDPKFIEEFVKSNPNKFYVKEYKHKDEETINNQE